MGVLDPWDGGDGKVQGTGGLAFGAWEDGVVDTRAQGVVCFSFHVGLHSTCTGTWSCLPSSTSPRLALPCLALPKLHVSTVDLRPEVNQDRVTLVEGVESEMICGFVDQLGFVKPDAESCMAPMTNDLWFSGYGWRDWIRGKGTTIERLKNERLRDGDGEHG